MAVALLHGIEDLHIRIAHPAHQVRYAAGFPLKKKQMEMIRHQDVRGELDRNVPKHIEKQGFEHAVMTGVEKYLPPVDAAVVDVEELVFREDECGLA